MRFLARVLTVPLLTVPFVLSGPPAQAAAPGVHVVTTHDTFAEYRPGEHAVTYRPELVPVGARARVLSVSTPGLGTTTRLAVTGLLPDRAYGAHVHTDPCGATGAAAGPHYQHVPDPVRPSVDPAYANPENEIWLDLTTDRLGRGAALSRVDWRFGPRRGKSIVLHEHHTATHPGHAGTAGARLACVDVPF
ncbi:superoxide dismutase, Cu-Zn family [Amycolatopsis arida]|uniref:Superoxide dismutase, Cu-Zn family n=1 Tax=Amycolatopsis arida TaxID=587909 RepID=A0A1I5STQ4_9PSEU|nr:superoxide dismutase family protein [Amycolatopsis arida]TDX96360.1 Cu-Zn family superoxide dismutase [Amycolatopsis arida]SFP73897.1 superoxide dismutase, Cu-Zn family [Amycolatopsis arida]